MSHILYSLLQRLDEWCEDTPEQALDTLFSFHDTEDRHASSTEKAVSVIAEGYWVYRLGNFCRDDEGEYVWKDHRFEGTEDEPLGFQLQQYGVHLRSLGFRLASYTGVAQECLAIRDRVPHPYPAILWHSIVDLVLSICKHFTDQVDWFGNPLPAPIDVLSDFAEHSTAYHRQGNTSMVVTATIDRQMYFLKRCYQPNPVLLHYDAFQLECAVNAVFRCLPHQFVAQTSGMYLNADCKIK
jgi:hypothetical protein